MKYGQPLSLMVYLTNAGAPLSYANAAAMTAAGWAVEWLDMTGALASPQPTWTLTPYKVDGGHLVGFTVPLVPSILAITRPLTAMWCDPGAYNLIATAADDDSIYGALFSAVGTPAAADRVTIYDWETVENDSFYAEMTFPAALLAAWGYADLSLAGWTVSAAARTDGDTGSGSPLFVYTARIVDAVNRIVSISFLPYPTAAALSVAEMQAGVKIVRYDVQARLPLSFTITGAIAGAGGTFTVAGDQRRYFSVNSGSTFTIASGPNAGTYTPTAINLVGGSTVLTVASVPSSTISGSIAVVLTLSGLKGTHRLTYQVDRS